MLTILLVSGIIYETLLAFITVLVILKIFKITDAETTIHLYKIPLIILAIFSALVLSGYLIELFIAYYSGAKYKLEALKIRTTAHYASQTTALIIPIILPFIRKNLKLTTPLILTAFFATKLGAFLHN